MTAERIRNFIKEDLRTLPEDHPDRPFIEAELGVFSAYSEIKATSLSKDIEKQEEQFGSRANYLRFRYGTLDKSDLKNLPISNLIGESPLPSHLPQIDNCDDFLRWYISRWHTDEAKKYSSAITTIKTMLIQSEEERVERLCLTEIENTLLPDLGLSARSLNSIRRFTGDYRRKKSDFYRETEHVLENADLALPSAEEAGTLCMRTRKELSMFRNIGMRTIEEIEEKLSKIGLSLATEGNKPLTNK